MAVYRNRKSRTRNAYLHHSWTTSTYEVDARAYRCPRDERLIVQTPAVTVGIEPHPGVLYTAGKQSGGHAPVLRDEMALKQAIDITGDPWRRTPIFHFSASLLCPSFNDLFFSAEHCGVHAITCHQRPAHVYPFKMLESIVMIQ